MRPTLLRVQGLKRWRDRTLDLGQLTAIQGPNGSGKTALIQAVRIALLGYDPETGKQLSETRKLLNPADAEIQIGLSFDSGFGIVRKLGAKTETLVVPPRGESTGRDCQARIDQETGGLLVTLNLGVFLELSDDKRREWLFEHLPQDAAVLDWETFAEWTDGETEDLKPIVSNLWKENVQSAPNPVVGLGSAIEVAKRQFLEADRERQNQGKVVARGEERLRLVEEPETVAPGALKEIETRLATTNQRIGTARAGAEALEAIQARELAAESSLAETMRELEHVEQVRADLVRQISEHVEAPETLQLEGQLGALEAEVERARAAHATTLGPLEDARALAARVLGRKDSIESHEGDCPFASMGCKTDASELIRTLLEEVDNELDVAVATRADAVAYEARAKIEVRDAEAKLGLVQREIEAAAKIRTDVGQLEKRSAHQGVVMQELRERAGIYRKSMEEAGGELAAVKSTTGLEGLYVERDELVSALSALNLGLRAAEKHANALELQRGEEDEHARLGGRAGVLKELDGNLRRLRAFVIQTMIEPLEDEARAILFAIDPAKMFVFSFERENRSIMDFGFQEEDGALRFYDAASKGERVMLVVAFVGALLKVLSPPMRLLVIDDLEQLYGAHRLGLLRGIAKLRDHFDAVIVAGACDFQPGLPPEWDLVDLQEADLDISDQALEGAAVA